MKKFLVVICLLLLAIVYLPQLLFASTGGDTLYIFKSMFKDFQFTSYAWGWNLNSGLGGFASPFGSTQVLTFVIAFLGRTLSFSWEIIQKLVFILPFLVFSFIGSNLLWREITHRKEFGWAVAALFMTNTYVLMLLSGGQYVVALAYSLVPLVIYLFIRYLEDLKWKHTLLFAVAFAVEIMLDLRFAYMTSLILVLLLLYFFFGEFQIFKKKFLPLVTSLVSIASVVILLQMFWLLPTMLHRGNPLAQLGSAYTTDQAVSYFSFAKFENAISLLHPNWPENIFGKVGFMKPEFLLLPIFAYASLLFMGKKRKEENKERKYIIFFALLGLLGAFLAKGANDPFGGIYLWMFDHVPGFIMFRDSSKWYMLVAVSYAILIPFSITEIYQWLKLHSNVSIFNFQFSNKSKICNLQNIFLLLTICCLLFTIRPALLWQLTGTFQSVPVPSDYKKLEQFLSQQDQFSRTLWVPTTQRFGYASSLHPAISARDYFNSYDNSKLLNVLLQKKTMSFLQEAGVKYIIVPYDSGREIFLKDRKYDNTSYQNVMQRVSMLPGVKKLSEFGEIGVFVLPDPKAHFWSPDEVQVMSSQINPTKYQVRVDHAKKGEKLIFSESFDHQWEASTSKFNVKSSMFDGKFNSFILQNNGNYAITVYYTPQKWVNVGLFISIVSLLSIVILEGYLFIRNKKLAH